MKKIKEIHVDSIPDLNGALLAFARNFKHAAIYSSNNYEDKYGDFELLAGFGAKRILGQSANSIEALKSFFESKPSWLFGHFNYDLKNELENLSSNHLINFGFENLSFFEPSILLKQAKKSNKIEVYLNEGVDDPMISSLFEEKLEGAKHFPEMHARMSKAEYLKAIIELKSEIQYGNIYEINYCQEFYAEQVEFNPYRGYLKLIEKSRTPFGAFYKNNSDYLLCASPERYIAKRKEVLISQPIKGTAKRGNSAEEDEEIKKALQEDLKEQTENVMIVDLVRNDLSRTARRGSVEVEELFGVYTFPQVHQLISTVKSKLKSDVHFTEVFQKSFPMGSMTGAPKISAMELIEKHEKSRRGLYSGSVGYITPKGDFDFNVIIRSLIFNAKSNYLSLSVGGAITSMSEPEKEYEECLLKAKAIFEKR